jgi:DNA-binding PucR family transcriptional regulator
VSTLLGEIDPEVLRTYRGTLLEPLERWDAERGAELVGTVRSFLEHGCRWRATAAALHIHHNTLRYRLKRVEELTGRDLGLVADRLDLQIALLVPQ